MDQAFEPEDDSEEAKLAKARRMAKMLSAAPVPPAEWATTTQWPGCHKRAGDRRVHATAPFVVHSRQRIWTACGQHVGTGGYAVGHLPVDCRACRRATTDALGEGASDKARFPS